MEDWKHAVLHQHQSTAFGFVGQLTTQNQDLVNANRARIGLRSLEIRNGLVEIEQETGMDFYLPGHPWQNGKITVSD